MPPVLPNSTISPIKVHRPVAMSSLHPIPKAASYIVRDILSSIPLHFVVTPMPPPTPNATDLTEVERTYLRSCIVNYRSTPPAEKEGFRDNCVKYIMRQCTISDTDPYVLQLIRLVSPFLLHRSHSRLMYCMYCRRSKIGFRTTPRRARPFDSPCGSTKASPQCAFGPY